MSSVSNLTDLCINHLVLVLVGMCINAEKALIVIYLWRWRFAARRQHKNLPRTPAMLNIHESFSKTATATSRHEWQYN